MSGSALDLADAESLPRWRRPESLLALMTFGMTLAFSTWMAALNNFVVEAAAFDGADIGVLHAVREIPGFLAFLVVFLLAIIAEQRLALLSLVALGVGTALTPELPSWWGLMATTVISSVGFHYFETVNQSLQLQWLPKERAPQALGRILSVASGTSLLVYGSIALSGWLGGPVDYHLVYWIGGGGCVAVTLFAWLAYPQFRAPHAQGKKLVLRSRYWLYYALVFMGGARRQIFVVFAAFMMVERFGFALHEVTALFLVTYLANMFFAPVVGRLIGRYGERMALSVEYVGLAFVFAAYAGVYFLGWGVTLALALYVLDHLFFAMAFAQKTYFQKIADPSDHAPTAAVAFTINHIAAVALPAPLGLLWLIEPGAVYALACAMALVSLGLSQLVPRHPEPGRETALTRPVVAPVAAPAE
ncbi:MAG: MFS transporter [Rubrimonas sp.]|uniref:MFS transporter n=1 Tax=Rubrimonas sp. TaxID=2036015 RepID=UPI002FDCBBF6